MIYDLTPVVQAVISLAIAVMTYLIIPYVKAKVGEQKYEQICEWVRIAVLAADQIYKGEGRGAEKKKYVLEFLNSKGFKIDAESIDALIESQVNWEHR